MKEANTLNLPRAYLTTARIWTRCRRWIRVKTLMNYIGWSLTRLWTWANLHQRPRSSISPITKKEARLTTAFRSTLVREVSSKTRKNSLLSQTTRISQIRTSLAIIVVGARLEWEEVVLPPCLRKISCTTYSLISNYQVIDTDLALLLIIMTHS